MGWKVIIAPSAEANLENIVRYIARHNPDSAARVGYALIARAEGLAAFPEIGRVVPELRRPDLREVIHRTFRVIYRVKRDSVFVRENDEISPFPQGIQDYYHESSLPDDGQAMKYNSAEGKIEFGENTNANGSPHFPITVHRLVWEIPPKQSDGKTS